MVSVVEPKHPRRSSSFVESRPMRRILSTFTASAQWHMCRGSSRTATSVAGGDAHRARTTEEIARPNRFAPSQIIASEQPE